MDRIATLRAVSGRAACLFVIATAVLCFYVAPASALNKIASGSIGPVAIDSGSAYWVVFNRSGSNTVMRRVLATSTDTAVYTTRKLTFVNALMAGGGRLAIETSRFRNTSEDTAVLTLSPAGGGAVTLATGRYGDTQREDCGTYIRLRDVAATGEVVVGSEQQKRVVAPCGDGANEDTMVLTGYAADGTTRLLKSATGTIKRDSSFYDRFIFKAELVGTRLLTVGTQSAEVTDLSTSGLTTYPRANTKHQILDADLDPTGRVLFSQLYTRGSASNSRGTLQLYTLPGNATTNSVLRSTRGYTSTADFCGSYMVEQYGAVDTLEQGNKLYRRNSAGTLMSLLYRAQPYNLIGGRNCDGGAVIFSISSDDTGTTTVYTVPLT